MSDIDVRPEEVKQFVNKQGQNLFSNLSDENRKKIKDLDERVNSLNQELITEIENRQDADVEFANNLSELDSKVDGINANLTQQIEETQQDINDKYNELVNDIDAEIQARENADTTINQRITDVADELNQTIEENVVALQQEDTALQNQINAQNQTLTNHNARITTNANAIAQEILDRQNNDDILTDEIENIAGELDSKQNVLVSGQNIKTINNQTILGSGNIDIQGGAGSFAKLEGNPYDNIALKGALDSKQPVGDYATNGDLQQEITNRQNADDALSDRIDAVESRGRFLALWNATTGLPESNPQITPYTYKTGDYYIVDAVGETNYRPTGTEFVEGQASTELETEELTTDDVYYYDGAVWRLQVNHGKTVSFGNLTGQPSDNTALKQALDSKQDVITDLGDIRNNIATNTSNISYLDEKVRDIELFKFPNAVIIGEPAISNGQVSGFSADNYMQFPFILDLHNTPFQIDFAFTTGNNVTTQQNILDSEFGLALAISNGKGLMAISGNGTSWNIGSSVGTIAIQPNTTYYARLTWDGMQYKTLISTNGTDYTQDMYLVGTQRPYPRTIFIGGCSGSAIGHTPHPFFGTINMNKAYLSTRGQVIWQGMDDAGLATRADLSLSNLDELGEKRFTDLQDDINTRALNSDLTTHTSNGTIHVTASDKISWNNKQDVFDINLIEGAEQWL